LKAGAVFGLTPHRRISELLGGFVGAMTVIATNAKSPQNARFLGN
jgi:hypothetical protein